MPRSILMTTKYSVYVDTTAYKPSHLPYLYRAGVARHLLACAASTGGAALAEMTLSIPISTCSSGNQIKLLLRVALKKRALCLV